MVDVPLNVPELVDVPTAVVSRAVAFGEPAATEAANVAKSATTAALMAMASPADTDDLEVIVSFVWFAIVSIAVKNVFQFDALIVAPAETVAIALCPSPYSPDPVPAKWLYPNGLDELFTNVLYSSSKIGSPAVYAINLFYSYHALC